jgi:superfamily II DNA helicase RecQ
MGRNNGVFKQKKDRRSRHHKRTKVQARPTGTRSFQERLIDMQAFNTTALLRFDLRDLPPLIEEGREPEYVDLQYSLLTVCLRIILLQQMASAGGSRRNPKDEQVYTLRRLIYGDGDTLLVAATGWGKSIIFHAYSILTAKTTIQIIPLKKLGGEQLEDIPVYN